MTEYSSHVFQDAKPARIDLEEDDPKAVNRILIYLYTLDYPDGEVPHTQKPTKAHNTSKPPHLRHPIQPVVSPGLESTNNANTESKLTSNALVHALAEKYDLPGLKIIAKEKFVSVTKNTEWPYNNFAEAVETVCNTAPSSDHELTDMIIDICASHIPEIVHDPELSAIIVGNGGLGLDIMCSQASRLHLAIRAFKKDRMRQKQVSAALKADLAKLKAELLQVKKEAQNAVNSKNDWNKRFDKFHAEAGDRNSCRQCGEYFMGQLQRMSSSENLRLQMRCTDCRTRNDIGAGTF